MPVELYHSLAHGALLDLTACHQAFAELELDLSQEFLGQPFVALDAQVGPQSSPVYSSKVVHQP